MFQTKQRWLCFFKKVYSSPSHCAENFSHLILRPPLYYNHFSLISIIIINISIIIVVVVIIGIIIIKTFTVIKIIIAITIIRIFAPSSLIPNVSNLFISYSIFPTIGTLLNWISTTAILFQYQLMLKENPSEFWLIKSSENQKNFMTNATAFLFDI